MQDRTPTEVLPNGAVRYGIYDENGVLLRYEYIKPEDNPTQEGTALNKTNLLSDVTAGLYGLDANAVPDDVLYELGKKTKSLLVRDLQIMLNQTLGSSNIDAWSDLLDDDSLIDTNNSDGYDLYLGKLYNTGNMVQDEVGRSHNDYNGVEVGKDNTSIALAQMFKNGVVSSQLNAVRFKIKKIGTPTPLRCELMNVGGTNKPSTLLEVSPTVIEHNDVFDDFDYIWFYFDRTILNPSTKYYLRVYKEGVNDTSNYYVFNYDAVYSSDLDLTYTQSTSGYSLFDDDSLVCEVEYITQDGTPAIVVWQPTTATEAFTKMAISSYETLNTGTITYYVSDDGTNWTEITASDTMEEVNFDATSVYVKAVITGNAELESIAWGGY